MRLLLPKRAKIKMLSCVSAKQRCEEVGCSLLQIIPSPAKLFLATSAPLIILLLGSGTGGALFLFGHSTALRLLGGLIVVMSAVFATLTLLVVATLLYAVQKSSPFLNQLNDFLSQL